MSEEDAMMTEPSEAKNFVENTNVDALAIAIGTAHGPYKGEPKLDFDRLSQIRELVSTPLVLHGASGVGEESIKRAVQLGITKINIDTDIRQAFTKGVHHVIDAKPEEYDPRKILGPAKEEMKQVIKQKMQLFGCSSKA